ncbi:hypothetical protein [Streptomyces sp. NPDC002328]|uniref:hypothetical protein n=1 Tax=Streptomyces sp. NPDC002328 TaxID=3364642 RepID=UPI0036A65E81
MDTQNLSAPSCAQALNPRGITHIKTAQTTRYTVVGNHLAQHRQLSLVAMGLALHIQSLPDQARVDIKTLADRFPEGETRIAAALRELKAHGYLAQIRKRLPNGRIVTHTVSYNQPQAAHPANGPAPAPQRPPNPASTAAPPPPAAPQPQPGPAPAPQRPSNQTAAAPPPPAALQPQPDTAPAPQRPPGPAAAAVPPPPAAPHPQPGPTPTPEPGSAPTPRPKPTPAPARAPTPTPAPAPTPQAAPDTAPQPQPQPQPQPSKPPLPAPHTPDPDLARQRSATALLATLHHRDPRLLLAERAVRHLAPAVAAWLERGARPEAVRHALTADLPEPLRNPAALLAHRLTELLPPAAPSPSPGTLEPGGLRPGHGNPAAPARLHSCEGCERAIRTPQPGAYCRDCRNRREVGPGNAKGPVRPESYGPFQVK